jgi:hypothetical protein
MYLLDSTVIIPCLRRVSKKSYITFIQQLPTTSTPSIKHFPYLREVRVEQVEFLNYAGAGCAADDLLAD